MYVFLFYLPIFYITFFLIYTGWDDEMITQNLAMRNNSCMDLNSVKLAMNQASRIVFVCKAQRDFYACSGPSSVIYVGVPPSYGQDRQGLLQRTDSKVVKESERVFTFLCLGIVSRIIYVSDCLRVSISLQFL